MRKVKEVLRLKHDLGLKDREIARSCFIPRNRTNGKLALFKQVNLIFTQFIRSQLFWPPSEVFTKILNCMKVNANCMGVEGILNKLNCKKIII